LKGCPSDIYYVVSQPDVSATELATSPFLRTLSSDEGMKTRVIVSEVVGMKGREGEELVRFIKESCGATRSEGFKPISGTGSVVVWKEFPALGSSAEEREEMLGDHGECFHLSLDCSKAMNGMGWIYAGAVLTKADSILHGAIQKDLPKGAKYTLIYLTTPSSPLIEKPIIYESDFHDALHMDLKRNLAPPRGNGSILDQRPLFEKYQFFSPGIVSLSSL
jgi:hypothetical protein